jgi:hypothetical protein
LNCLTKCAAGIFALSGEWTKPSRFFLITLQRSNQPACCGITSSGRPRDCIRTLLICVVLTMSILHCLHSRTQSTIFRQEVEPIDEDGNGGKPVVTGILQGASDFVGQLPPRRSLNHAPIFRSVQLSVPPNIQLRCAHGLHERVTRTRGARDFASALEVTCCVMIRCLSGADARDDSPPKLKRTKDGNIVPPWPNKVLPLALKFAFQRCCSLYKLSRRSCKTFNTPNPWRPHPARTFPFRRSLRITVPPSAASVLAAQHQIYSAPTPRPAARRPGCFCPGQTREKCSCCWWPTP